MSWSLQTSGSWTVQVIALALVLYCCHMTCLAVSRYLDLSNSSFGRKSAVSQLPKVLRMRQLQLCILKVMGRSKEMNAAWQQVRASMLLCNTSPLAAAVHACCLCTYWCKVAPHAAMHSPSWRTARTNSSVEARKMTLQEPHVDAWWI